MLATCPSRPSALHWASVEARTPFPFEGVAPGFEDDLLGDWEVMADDRPLLDSASRIVDSPAPHGVVVRLVSRRGVAIARLTGPVLTDSPELEGLERVLDALIACGNDRLILDFGGVNRISRRLLAVLVRAHRGFAAVGGRLKLCGLRPELTRFVSLSRLDHVLTVASDAESAVTGEWVGASRATRVHRPRPLQAAEVKTRREARPRHGRAFALDEIVSDWLARGGTSASPRAASVERKAHRPPREPTLDDPLLGCQVLMDILVLEPRQPRLEGEPAVGPLLQALVAIHEEQGPSRVVIDMRQVVVVSVRTVAALAVAAASLARAGGELRLCHVRSRVMRAVNESRLVHLAKVYSTVDEAVLDPWD